MFDGPLPTVIETLMCQLFMDAVRETGARACLETATRSIRIAGGVVWNHGIAYISAEAAAMLVHEVGPRRAWAFICARGRRQGRISFCPSDLSVWLREQEAVPT